MSWINWAKCYALSIHCPSNFAVLLTTMQLCSPWHLEWCSLLTKVLDPRAITCMNGCRPLWDLADHPMLQACTFWTFTFLKTILSSPQRFVAFQLSHDCGCSWVVNGFDRSLTRPMVFWIVDCVPYSHLPLQHQQPRTDLLGYLEGQLVACFDNLQGPPFDLLSLDRR